MNERELLSLKQLSFDALAHVARNLPVMQRIRTAAFCYGKSHLHEIGLAVAACCSFVELTEAFGRNARIVESQAKAAGETRQQRLRKGRTTLSLLRSGV